MMSQKAEFESFEDALAWGEEGEKEVADYFIGKGACVVPLYQFHTTGAPFMLERVNKHILPDLMCWQDGKSYFVESKRKNRWVRFDGNMETGFNYHHYKHYCAVQEKTGVKVYVYFLHENEEPTGLFFGELSELGQNLRYWDGKFNGCVKSSPLALFPLSCLTQVKVVN